MKESPFGFEYTWEDMKPVRALSIAVLAAQLCGAIAALAIGHHPRWFSNLWFGGALATFPGYLIGLAVQHHLRPGSLGENLVLVRRMGIVALILSIAAIFFPFGEGHAA